MVGNKIIKYISLIFDLGQNGGHFGLYVLRQHFSKFRRAPRRMLINGSYGSVLQHLVLLSAKYCFFFAKLPDYFGHRGHHMRRTNIQQQESHIVYHTSVQPPGQN